MKNEPVPFSSTFSSTVRYVYGLDLIAQVRGTNPSYYHYDGLGSTRQLTDGTSSTPQIKNQYTYEAFGGWKTAPPTM